MTPALDRLLRRLGRRRVRTREKPLRDELLSIERLEERAKALAARLTVDPTPRRNARDVFPRFDDNARVLREAYLSMAEDVHRGEFVTAAAEWLLDNYHLVASEIRDVRQNLPRGYYRDLPKLATRELAGDARVYALAVELIRHSDSRLDRQQLLRFLNSYQTVAPLTIGELWAWPSMLKLALIENLRRLAEEAIDAREARQAADDYVAQIDAAGHGRPPPLPPEIHPAFVVQLLQRVREYGPRLSAVRAEIDAHLLAQHMASEEAIRSEHQHQAAAQVSVANVITSLRLCSTLDWSQYFESVSLVEGVLQRDPAAVLRPHGLPEPRPLPPGGGGPGRRHRGGPAPGGPADGRERSPGRRGRNRRARGPRGPPPHRQGPRRPRGRRGLPAPAPASHAAVRVRPRHRGLPRDDRSPDRAAARPGLRLRAPAGRRALAAGLGGAPPAAAGERRGDRRRPEPLGPLRPAAAAPPPRLPGRGAGERADHGRRADAPHERRAGHGAPRAPRGAGPRATSIRASTSRSSATSRTPPPS